MIEVCFAVYKRNHRIPAIIKDLKKQTNQDFKVNIWNNSGKKIEFPGANIVDSKENIGPIGIFKLAKQTKGNPIIFFDDDEKLYPDFIEYNYQQYLKRPNTVQGWFSRIFKDVYSNSLSYKDIPPYSEVDYVGTGGMVVDRSIFEEEDLQDIPNDPKGRFIPIDLYLCYVARRRGMGIRSIEKKVDIIEDEHDTSLSVGGKKDLALKELRRRGFKLINKVKNTMRIVILGSNGYIGNALINHLEKKGYEVYGCDNGLRDRVAPESLTEVKKHPKTVDLDICDYESLKQYLKEINPDAIIHLAEQPSAPFSMKSPEASQLTQGNNIIGSLNVLWAIKEINPKIHLIKLGTAGEYPDWLYPKEIQIPEGARIKVKRKGVDWEIPTPRYAGSFYHMSKLHDSNNCDYANRVWGLKITDINQAPVYGHQEGTRFDYDEEFGTVVNRFVAQALAGYPLTVYGKGGQTRGYIHIKNALEAIEIVLNNEPEGFRIIHQLTETKSVMEIAELVKKHTGCKIKPVENPRAENPTNEFDFEMKFLKDKGLKPIYMEDSIKEFIDQIKPYKDNINEDLFEPKIKWK